MATRFTSLETAGALTVGGALVAVTMAISGAFTGQSVTVTTLSGSTLYVTGGTGASVSGVPCLKTNKQMGYRLLTATGTLKPTCI